MANDVPAIEEPPGVLSYGVAGPVNSPPLHISDYDFELPPDRVAMHPAQPRDSSRLLVVTRETGTRVDSSFRRLRDHLEPTDLLVLNNTRVLKARLNGTLERTGRPVEVLYVRSVAPDLFEAMLRPARRIRAGDRIVIDADAVLEVADRPPGVPGASRLRLRAPSAGLDALLERWGAMPLPPYIARAADADDDSGYQTVFARHAGAIAAPTAGLHFTPEVLASLKEAGVETVEITLHVGPGTFVPVRDEDPRRHRLLSERFTISAEAAARLNAARAARRRIVAVGTTVTRTLEYAYGRRGRFVGESGDTDLYILPGYRFQVVDALLTNFHLPRSTLLFLVCAFAGREAAMDAYRYAIRQGYRFYSYGDCCLWL